MRQSLASVWLLRLVVLLVPLVSLIPFGRLVADWIEFARVVDVPLSPLPPRGFDWVRWQDVEGDIVAVYVDPRGTAYQAGVREGAKLYELGFQQYFSSEDVKRVIERSSGSILDYEVTMDGKPRMFEVQITRYPTFLYPLDSTLWVASGWGYALVTFIHILAFLIVVPLAFRSDRARRSSILIGAALVWVGGTFIRFLIVTLGGPPELGSPFVGAVFEGLTILSLAGWLLFPALLVRYVLRDVEHIWTAARLLRPVVFLAPVVLGVAVMLATIRGSIGPLPPDTLTAPILFYVCVYVASAMGLILLAPSIRSALDESQPAPVWSRVGSLVVFVMAVAGALFALGALPELIGEDDATAGFITVSLQLFSVAPVTLVSLSTLRYGRFNYVLTRGLAYAATLGLIFFAFVAGVTLLEAIGPTGISTSKVALGLLLIALLILVERSAKPIRAVLGERFRTDRDRARQRLNLFGDRVRTILDTERLAQETIYTIGEALDVRSAVLFLRDRMEADNDHWTQATYQPSPPFFTRNELAQVWSHIQAEGKVWAANPELNESRISDNEVRVLKEYGVALVLPVTSGRGEPVGVLVLSRKTHKRAVYNLEDVEMLKALCGQVALATERLALIEREKALVRESAEAQLTALRAQINPHFLFNALNTIAALISEKPGEAEDTVQQLAGLFRYVLQTGSRTFVPLEEEIRLVRQYLAIEQARFGDKLEITEDWDESLMSIAVPAFAIQTLVENAVKHGIERKRRGGLVSLASRKLENGVIEIEVADTGAGIPALFLQPLETADADHHQDSQFFGIGLRNVADRLEQLYGRSDLLDLSSSPHEGTIARLRLPTQSPGENS